MPHVARFRTSSQTQHHGAPGKSSQTPTLLRSAHHRSPVREHPCVVTWDQIRKTPPSAQQQVGFCLDAVTRDAVAGFLSIVLTPGGILRCLKPHQLPFGAVLAHGI